MGREQNCLRLDTSIISRVLSRNFTDRRRG